MDRKKQHRSKSNAPRSGSEAATAAASGRHGKGGKAGGGGGKKPIKVVYISNPMRVKTSAEGFRALVQELTGRHADPSKYSPDDFDCEGAARALIPEELVGAATSPEESAAVQDDVAAAPGQLDFAGAATSGDGEEGRDGDEDDDIFRSQLLDNNYSVFSPPTLLYDHPHSNKLSFC